MARILADTSAVYALFDVGDTNHRSAVALLKKMRLGGGTPLLTNFVVSEIYSLLLSRLGGSIARRWLFDNQWPIERVSQDDETSARAILRRYDDKGFSYVDATSFAVMERLKLSKVFGFDGHFVQYGFEILRASR